MAYSNALYQQWLNQCGIFSKNIKVLKKKYDKEVLHDARVALKKMRACLHLAGLITTEKKLEKSLPETLTLFRVLGKQRDIEMSLFIVTAFKKNNKISSAEFEKHLKTSLDDTSFWVNNSLAAYKNTELNSVKRKMRTRIAPIEEEHLAELIRRTCTIQLHRVKTIAKNFSSGFHEIRKKLKEIYYWEKLYPSGLLMTDLQIKELNSLLDELGSLQDHIVLLDKLKAYRKLYLPKKTAMYDSAKKNERLVSAVIGKMLSTQQEKIIHFAEFDERKRNQQQEMMIFSAPGPD